ncbi:putative Zinc finger, SWIM-type, FHY3/FAR1 family [Helianthus annuus]|nr:putative Zinc finger, SWIM-type, FHY3/FAR1 family [Helianthus annuus]
MYHKSDCTCNCSCRSFEQFGLLCRHIFYVLRSLDIREFRKQYILNRWRKEASPNCSPEYSISHEYITELDPDVQSMMREIIFSIKDTLNRLSGNKEELSLYKDHVQSYIKKVQDMQIVFTPLVVGIDLRRKPVNIKMTRIREEFLLGINPKVLDLGSA